MTNEPDPLSRILEAIRSRGLEIRNTSSGFQAQCPAHEDGTPSLSLSVGDDGRALVFCHGGCSTKSVIEALGLSESDLFAAPVDGSGPIGVAERHFSIRDLDGREIARHHRRDTTDGRKEMWWSRAGVTGLGGIKVRDLPLFGSEHLRGRPDETVIVTEGEKACEALQRRGLLAVGTVTGAGGKTAKCPNKRVLHEALAGRDVVLWPDDDDIGRDHMMMIARHLQGVAKAVRTVSWVGPTPKCDAADFDGTNEELLALLELAVPPTLQNGPGATNLAEAGHQSDPFPIGQRDAVSGRFVLDPKRTLPSAEAYLADQHQHPDGPTLRSYAGSLWRWSGNRYVELEDDAFRAHAHPWLAGAVECVTHPVRGPELRPFPANPRSVNDLLATVRAAVHIPSSVTMPAWIGDGPPHQGVDARDLLIGRTRSWHLPTGRAIEPTPRLFTGTALGFDLDPSAQRPTRWLAFLDQLFEDDPESAKLLQQWFGYCLTADTCQQKAMLIVGPRRSGKGTIGRVLSRLVGAGNVAGPTIGSLAGQFGLQTLVGRTLAIVSDARFAGEGMSVVTERLLCVIGEDALSIDRKHREAVTIRLPTRFMFLTNELPKIGDTSTALAGRFLVIQLRRSFFDQEDHGLLDALLDELPGILQWAIAGWRSLREAGRFTIPLSARAAIRDIEDLSSPVSAFIRDRCSLRDDDTVAVGDLYHAWKEWCVEDGRQMVSTRQSFSRDLRAVVSTITLHNGTGNVRFFRGIGIKSRETPEIA